MAKEIKYGIEARKALEAGVYLSAGQDAVALSHAGRGASVTRSYRLPV